MANVTGKSRTYDIFCGMDCYSENNKLRSHQVRGNVYGL